MKLVSILLSVVFFAGCRPVQKEASPVSLSALPNTVSTLPPPAKPPTVPPISEITLERSPGHTRESIVIYALTLRSDGTVTYIGTYFGKVKTKRSGTYRATIPQSEFIRLAQLVEESRFMSFAPFYGHVVRGKATVSVSIVRKEKRKTVMDCGKPFQPEYEKEAETLKKIEQQIDAAVASATWVKVSDNTQTPRYIPERPFAR